MQIAFSFFLLIYSRVARQLLGPHDTLLCVLILESQTCAPVILFDKGMHITDCSHCKFGSMNLQYRIDRLFYKSMFTIEFIYYLQYLISVVNALDYAHN